MIWQKIGKHPILYHLRKSLWLQEKENLVDHTRIQKKIQAEMENIEMQQNEDGNESINAFASVMGREHSGRLRLYGRGVTKTTLKGKVVHFKHSSNATNDLVQKMEEWMMRLMEEKLEEQKEQFEEQSTTMRQEIVENLTTKLQCSGLPIDANLLATLVEAFSTRATTIQPIHRPSIGGKDQGERNEQGGDESSERNEQGKLNYMYANS
ncbi:uncharacterized protein LOC132631653 isoform X2 [Lycium barbarum]|uniref:uncharacterized protein LOC132631653 isoform X2 n=1 Tax=Lycium barbarum TaxID=112863 RepID=UPI00293EDD74|nr:uncharacterized protein LOC132631653 isoform X2 [Lycium barbarum]XP_060203298.1 uncharacterized protein LOC132631653 isoform X2 [Lycium barbarum]